MEPDVREAAELVLPHRLRRQPFSDSEMDENKLEETFRKHQEDLEQRRRTAACAGARRSGR